MSTTLDENLNIISGNENLEIELLGGDLNIIQKLPDEPNDVGGLTAQELKAEFDKAGNIIKGYINETLIPAIVADDATQTARAAAEAQRERAEQERVSAEQERVRAEANRTVWESYSDTKNYQPGNKVYYMGSSYINLVSCAGVSPEGQNASVYWQKIADRGLAGSVGPTGPQGPKGDAGARGERGLQGEKGEDGTPCTHVWNGTVLTVTSASGTSSADLKGTVDEDRIVLQDRLTFEKYELYMSNGKLTANLMKLWSVLFETANCTAEGAADAYTGDSYRATITAHGGYEISSVNVSMGGEEIEDFEYSNGVLKIPRVTGDVIISASAEPVDLPEMEGA